MPVVRITSADPIQMYWRMVFYGAAEPGAELVVEPRDDPEGLVTVRIELT